MQVSYYAQIGWDRAGPPQGNHAACPPQEVSEGPFGDSAIGSFFSQRQLEHILLYCGLMWKQAPTLPF